MPRVGFNLDAFDAIELAEIVEFLIGSLDALIGSLDALIAPATTVPTASDAYDINDLRADAVRLTHRLRASRPTRLAPGAANRPLPLPALRSDADNTAVIVVEVDRGSASSRGRPPEQTWLVRLRCANHSVVVAIGLHKAAADHLADHIADVIAPATNSQQRRPST
jgi:hypothetical protein